MKAVAAAVNERILLIDNTGTTVAIADTPLLSWVVDETGTAPARPVTLDRLTEEWAHCVIHAPTSPRELIGGSNVAIDIYVPDVWRGTFSAFLDWLVTTTGLPVDGSQLLAGPLVERFGEWVGSGDARP